MHCRNIVFKRKIDSAALRAVREAEHDFRIELFFLQCMEDSLKIASGTGAENGNAIFLLAIWWLFLRNERLFRFCFLHSLRYNEEWPGVDKISNFLRLRNRNDPWAQLRLTDSDPEVKVCCSIPENIRTFFGVLFPFQRNSQHSPHDETLPLSLLPEKSLRCRIYLHEKFFIDDRKGKVLEMAYEMMTIGNTMPVNCPETGSSVDGSKSDLRRTLHMFQDNAPEHAHTHHDAAHSHDSFHASDHGHSFDASSADPSASSSACD